LIAELRPASLDQLGLQPALEDLVARTRASNGLAIELCVEIGEGAGSRLGPEIESVIYRVVQEGLTNVVKHARAETCRVAVVEETGDVTVTISDDGGGFSEAEQTTGFGLLGMRERLALVAGRLEIESEAAAGTTLSAVIPAARMAGAADPGVRRAG
jgi:signal transduction histidine kinase